MSDYTKTTDFEAKDSLPSGDTGKIIKGAEFEVEFDAISTAIATKADTAGPTFTGTVTIPTADINGGNVDGTTIGASTAAAGTFTNLTATGTVDFSSGNVTTNIDGGTIDNAVIGGSTPAAGTFTAVAGTTATFSAGVSGTTGTFSGAVTGSNLNVSNWDTAFGWGNHASAGYLTSVAFSDIDAAAVTLSTETFTDSDSLIPTNAAVIDYVAATIPLISEVNDLSSVVTWANVPDANITESSVTQHEAALSITASQLSDVTSTATEINYLDVTTLGTTEASKAVTADANGDVTFAGDVTFSNAITEDYNAVSDSSGTTTVDLSTGTNFSSTLSANTQFAFTSPASSGSVSAFTLKIVQDASASGYTVTWPGSVNWPSATAPTLTATASAVDYFVFITHDGGTNWYGFTAGQAFG